MRTTSGNMSQYKMSNEEVMKFVLLYCERECLWNTHSKDFKNRLVRNAALQEICSEMNIEGFGIPEATYKIRNLRKTYLREIRKIAQFKSTPTSEVYMTNVEWFSTMHFYLGRHFDADAVSTDARGDASSPTFNPSKKRCHSKTRDTTEATTPMQPAPEPACESEFDIWSKYLATQLNDMEKWRALDLQMRINNLVSRERISFERSRSYFLSGSVCPSFSFSDYHSGDGVESLHPEYLL